MNQFAVFSAFFTLLNSTSVKSQDHYHSQGEEIHIIYTSEEEDVDIITSQDGLNRLASLAQSASENNITVSGKSSRKRTARRLSYPQQRKTPRSRDQRVDEIRIRSVYGNIPVTSITPEEEAAFALQIIRAGKYNNNTTANDRFEKLQQSKSYKNFSSSSQGPTRRWRKSIHRHKI